MFDVSVVTLNFASPALSAGKAQRRRLRAAWLRLLITLVTFTGLASLHARGVEIAQDFLVPMPEDQMIASFRGYEATAGPTIDSAISIATMQVGTVIVYDHWEDGYEADLSNPTQASTQVWGDNNVANGLPPGFTSDIITAASVVVLRNLIDTPRNPADHRFDGRDQIGVTKPVALTRMCWATNPGSVLAASYQVQSTLEFGTQFVVPIGENTPNNAYNEMFERVEVSVMAAENGTLIQIDSDNNGTFETTTTLNMGQSFAVAGIQVGARMNASKPVQAHLITGDVGATYESRWFNLFPRDTWGSEYFNPVGTTSAADPGSVFLYNPNTFQINVQAHTRGGGTTIINVPAGQTAIYEMPPDTGARFRTTGAVPPVFTGLVAMDTDQLGAENTSFEWGFTLIPKSSLTAAIKIGYGPGTSDIPPTDNGSPAWIIAESNTRLYVDYDGDLTTGPLTDPNGNKYDFHQDVAALESVRFTNPNNDQTGMRVYAPDGTKITAAWGEDPSRAQPGTPFLDLGYTVLPHPLFFAVKTGAFIQDLNQDGVADRDDIIEYTITVTNIGIIPVNGVTIVDKLEGNVTYTPGSTTLEGVAVADNSVPPAATVFPLDEAGFSIGSLGVRQSKTIRFRVVVGFQGPNSLEIRNTVLVSIVEQDRPEVDDDRIPTTPTPCPNITLSSSRPVPSVALTGETYNATFTNNGRDGPYVYQIASGSLPPGLNLSSAGVLSGIPTTPGTYSFTLIARDIYTCPAQAVMTIIVANPLELCPSVSVLPRGLQGMPYSLTLTPAGGTGPYVFDVLSGSLPSGLTLNATTGEIAGIPTASQTRSFVIRATDAVGTPTSLPYELQIVSSASLLTASAGNNNIPITRTVIRRAGISTVNQTASAPGVTSVTTDTLDLTQLSILDQGVAKTLSVVNRGGGRLANVTISPTATDYGTVNAGVRQTVAALGFEPFKIAAAATASNSNLNSYIDDNRGDTLPDGLSEYDMLFDLPFGIDDFIVLSERNGNSTARLTPLGADGNPLPNSNSIQFGPPYDWNTGFASPYNSGQPYWLTVVRAGTFGVTQPIHGFRVDTRGADIKFFGMSESTFPDAPGVPAAVGDRVWADLNENGLQDSGEPGVANITVELRRVSNNAVIKTVVSDSAGRYQFTHVAPGDYRVRFAPAPAFTFTSRAIGTNRTLDSDVDPQTGFTSAFSIQPCERRSDLDAGLRFLADYGDLASLPVKGSLITTNLRLGANIDGETAPLLNNAATGDDLNHLDDEDGVILPPALLLTGTNSITVNTTNLTAATAYLSVWVDFNQNGRLDDPGEQVASDLTVPANTPSQNRVISFVAPANAFAGQAGIRVSLNSLSGTLATGVSGSGETEDYLLPLVCPVITLSPSLFPVTREDLPFQMPFVAEGGTAPYRFDVTSGALPTWAQLDNTTGIFNGTPDSTTSATFTVRVTDIHGCSTSREYTITPLPRPKLAVGNLVFFDTNDNGRHDPGEGLPNVPLQLYSDSQIPGVDSPLAATTSSANGTYLFGNLESGLYQVHIPAAAFQPGGALDGLSVIAEGFSGDDDVGQNGRKAGTPEVDGVSSGIIALFLGNAPTLQSGETGFLADSDDDLDAAVDLTVDFGFQLPMMIGNRIFHDHNRNGRYDEDESEGVEGVIIELFRADQDPTLDRPILTQSSSTNGLYLFSQLVPGGYQLHIPAEEFLPGAPLYQLESMPDTIPGDDDVGEDGIDDPLPSRNGISSRPINLVRGAQPTDTTTETGSENHLDNRNDANGNLTIDFGFRSRDPLEVGVGNLVFTDQNGNGTADAGEGVAGVLVQLFAEGDDPLTDSPLAVLVTEADGLFLFRGLIEGAYFLHIPASEFQPGKPLAGFLSIPGAGEDWGLDDDFDENGLDSPNPWVTGISSTRVYLAPDTEPENAWGESGLQFDVDDADDNNTDLTVDLGFTIPVSVGNLVFLDANSNGRADPGEGVPGVTVQLFSALAQPLFDAPIAETTTDAQGRYLFADLGAGDYMLHIPSWMFASGAPLANRISLPGTTTGDDNTSEDGIDNPQAAAFGISSGTVSLYPGLAPAGSAESGFDAASDDASDTHTDLTIDFGFSIPATLGGLVFHDLNGDGLHQPNGVDGQPFTADDEPVLPVVPVEIWHTGSDRLIGGGDDRLIDTLETQFDGSYLREGLSTGTYYVRIPESAFAPSGALAGLPVISPVRIALDNQTPGDNNGAQPAGRATAALSPVITLAPEEVDTSVGFGFMATVHPLTWPAWQLRNGSLADTTFAGNPDGDAYSNLLEFAFGLDSKTGVAPRPPVRIEVDPATQRIDLCVDRVTGTTGLTFTVQLLSDLATSPGGWVEAQGLTPVITQRPNQTEEVRYQDIASHPALVGSQGFARLVLSLDADLNGEPEAVQRTETVGWSRLTLGTHLQTLGHSFAPTSRFTALVGSVNGTALDVTAALNGATPASLLTQGAEHYLEVLTGTHVGHRLELNESATATTTGALVLDTAHLRNTLTGGVPDTLAGARIALRQHLTLGEIADRTRFAATNNATTADRVMLFDPATSAFQSYWLFHFGGNPRWVRQGDGSLANQGSLVIPPGLGLFVQPRTRPVTVILRGLVRDHAFARPLVRGPSLCATGWPMTLTPNTANMTAAAGFTGATSATQADQIQNWTGDIQPGTQNYTGLFLLRLGTRNTWSNIGDSSLANQNNNPCLRAHRAFFLRTRNAIPNWITPRPWTP